MDRGTRYRGFDFVQVVGMKYKPPQEKTRVPSELMGDIHAALPTSGNGRLVRDLAKRGLGTIIEINNALAEMLDRGEVRRNGKRWIAVETTVYLGNGLIVKVMPEPKREPLYPVLCEALEDVGYSRYQGRAIRRQKRTRVDRVLSVHEDG